MKVVRQGKLQVYVYTRGDPKQPSPMESMLLSLPAWFRAWHRVEHLAVGAGVDGQWTSVIYQNRVLAEERTRRIDGSVRRRPIFNPDMAVPLTGFRIIDYQEEETMTDVMVVRLSDGKETDNTGWKRTERTDGKVFFTKMVNGKLYVLDRWAAMGARIQGSLMNTPGYVAPGAKAPSKDAFVATPKMRRVMAAPVPFKKSNPVVKEEPKRKSFSHGDVLSRKARELMTPSRKTK